MNCPQAAAPRLKRLAFLIVFSLVCNLSLCAQTAPTASTMKPRITGIQFKNVGTQDKPGGTPSPSPSPSSAPSPTGTGTETGDAAKKKIPFTLEITGEGFGTTQSDIIFSLLDALGKNVLENSKIVSLDDKNLVISGEAAAGTYDIKLEVKGQLADNPPGIKVKLALAAEEKPGIKKFEVKFTTYPPDKLYPNLYTMVITNEENNFDTNMNRMQVSIVPAGASNILVKHLDPRQMELTFLAPDKFEAKDVLVTVYNSSDLDTRLVKFVSEPSKQQPKTDPNQPVIKNTELVFLDRTQGLGRLKIEGTGFGHDSPRSSASETYFYCNALQERVDFLAQLFTSPQTSSEEKEELKKQLTEAQDMQSKVEGELKCSTSKIEWEKWTAEVNRDVKVLLVPRNPTFRIDRVQIININDKLIDVYFKFATITHYSQPFRLAGANVSVLKPGVNALQTVSGQNDKKATGAILGPASFLATASIGEPRSPNLQYYYTVLDKKSALPLFGRGVANNFYVIQLSVSNIGAKKVNIPLSSIKAEVEWAVMSKVHKDKHFPFTTIPIPGTGQDFVAREGPATIPPLPLTSVSGYADGYNKAYGKRAILMNFLSGFSTLMTPFTQIFGPGFTDAQNPYNAGVIPFAKAIFPDMSSEQRQNLIAQSWSDVESLSAGGGHVTKYIFIPKGAVAFSTPSKDNFGDPVVKQIKDVVGLDVIGFEITEGAVVGATEASQSNPVP